MKRLTKRIAAAGLALALTLSLAACGGGGLSSFDATKYIKGLMDETYLGVFDQGYMDMVEIDEAEAEATYLGGLEVEATYFADFFLIDNVTDELNAEIIELYKEIYAKSEYTVSPATKIDEDTFGVKVQVKPLDIFHLVSEAMDDHLAEFYAKYDSATVDAMDDEAYAAYDAEWAALILELCREKLPEMGHLEEKSLVVQVSKDADDIWGIPDEDFSNLDYLIIDYNI